MVFDSTKKECFKKKFQIHPTKSRNTQKQEKQGKLKQKQNYGKRSQQKNK